MSLKVEYRMNGVNPIGTRVLMMEPHPHAGKAGYISRYETIHLFREEGPKPVIQLDDGMQCFAMKATDFGIIPKQKRRKAV